MSSILLYLSVAVITFHLLVNEVILGSIFNILLGNFNAMIAIAIALLGLSASALFVYIKNGSLPQDPDQDSIIEKLFKRMVLFIFASIICPVIIINIPVHYGDFIFEKNNMASIYQILAYFFAAIPFYMGGLCIYLIFTEHTEKISILYFADLVGAALGCILSPVLLKKLGAPAAMICAIIPTLTIIIICSIKIGLLKKYAWSLLAIFGAIMLASNYTSILIPKKLNSFSNVMNPVNTSFKITKNNLEFEGWSEDGWTIIRSKDTPQQWENFRGWGLSDNYDGFIPEIKLVNYNSRFSTYITEFDGDFSKIGRWMDSDLISLHYQLGRKFPNVLNIGAGGGREVLCSLYHGAEKIAAVDISHVVIESIMKKHLKEFSGNLFFHPKVEAIVDEGRSYVARQEQRYDLIEFSIVGGFQSEKLDLIAPDRLFTQEALQDYLNHLTPDGVLSYVMYGHKKDLVEKIIEDPNMPFLPYVPPLKTLTGIKSCFEKKQSDFKNHVLIAAKSNVINPNYDLVHMLISLTPWTDHETEQFIQKTQGLGFELYYPDTESKTNIYAQVIENDNFEQFTQTLPFKIYPPTDQSPFFYSLDIKKMGDFNRYSKAISRILQSPLITAVVFLGLVTAFVLLGPLFIIPRNRKVLTSSPNALKILSFFALIGCGYMFIEISIIYQIQLYLGHPVYALSIGLFTFLFGSGLGSFSTNRINNPVMVQVEVALVCCFGLFFFLTGKQLMAMTLSFLWWQRAVVVVMMVGPMAFAMGMLFPTGVKMLTKGDQGFVPWICAVNTVFSIFSLFLIRLIVLLFNVKLTLIIGLVFYCILGVVYSKKFLLNNKFQMGTAE